MRRPVKIPRARMLCGARNPCGIEVRQDKLKATPLSPALRETIEAGRTRLLVTGMIFALAFAAVGGRLVDLALLEGDSDGKAALTASTQPGLYERADIIDRNGIMLATTLPSASLYANPKMIRDPAATARRIASVLPELSETNLHTKLSEPRSFVWIKRHLTPKQKYLVNRLGIPGLQFQQEYQRFYPHGRLLAHTVGFTGMDNQGLAGVEQFFDKELAQGQGPLQLSLDVRVQHILTEELAAAMKEFGAIGASGIVLDARNGEVVALSSLPSFDPNSPGTASPDARFNRASLGIYEMGSVFKIFTTAMALDRGVVSLNDGYDTSKPIRAARFTIRDFKPKNRWLSIPEIFIYSSNIGTVHMAMDVGTEVQKAYLRNLGLLTAPSLELGEVGRPLLPTPWREINTMTISYGHGLAVSPVQIAAGVAAVVNGGELLPVTLVKRTQGDTPQGQRVISEKTSQVMRRLMRLVVSHGTGRFAEVEGYLVGGKTGTADKQVGGGYARNKRIASFVGAFPMNDPRYVVITMLDEPKGNKSTHGYATGGWIAAPAVGKLVERIGPLVGIRPVGADYADVDSDKLLVQIKANAKGRTIASN